ncbi:DUF6691 family protein [Rugamonas sp. CCM 8940]|uniref:YeeE/YedE family protein n=1 Tax=Rugamonas sp. CCM 8940 TaxID=2765359 RepID=UPI0018F4AC78|nr:YeeE/YedE family protein [Rugamonas sp. CCM 8940]MBJ7312211.1 YeeE/YedE family protein [Rugamonas sp. CCM 8940]
MLIVSALLAGLVFGWGLIVSGMANPAKVLGFLDLAGGWDPSLMLVMGGAIGVGVIAFALARRRSRTWLGAEIKLPTAQAIDRRLIVGSSLFGIGWGIAGICPGPALVGVGMGLPKMLLFVGAMLAGMLLFEAIEQWRRKQAASQSRPG